MRISIVVLLLILFACNSKPSNSKSSSEVRRETANTIDAKELLKLISKGGYIVYFRHSHRDKHAIPQITRDQDIAKLCIPGTELSPLGYEEAKRLSFSLKLANVPEGEIYTSPTCRTHKTAEIVFPGMKINEIKELLYVRILTPDEIELKKIWKKEFYSQKISDGTNVYVFGHEGEFDLKDVVLDESEALVFKPDGINKNYIGKIDRKTLMR
jgi:hypothetical protein